MKFIRTPEQQHAFLLLIARRAWRNQHNEVAAFANSVQAERGVDRDEALRVAQRLTRP